MKKYVLTWGFTVIAFLIICSVFYTVIPRPNQEAISLEEQLKSLEKQISAYRSNDPHAYQILEKLYSEKGHIHRHNEEYSEAYYCYREALPFAQKNEHHKNMAELAWLMIGLAAEQKQNALVLSLSGKYQKLIEQYNADSFSLPLHKVYYWRGVAYLAKNQTEAACKDLNKGLKLLSSGMHNDYSGDRVLFYCALGTVYARKQASFKAAGYLNKAVELLENRSCLPDNDIYLSLKNALTEIEKNNPPRSIVLGETYHKLAKLHNRDNNPDEYWDNMQKAIETYPAAGPQIAEVYFELGEDSYANPKYYFDKCATALAGVKSNSAATMLMKIALHYMDCSPDKVPHVLQLTLKALPDSKPDLFVTAQTYQLLARHFSETKEWVKSVDFSRRSLAVLKKDWNIEERTAIAADCFLYLDQAYEAEKAVQKRLKNAEDARTFMESESGYCYLPEIYKRLGQIYTALKQYQQAENSYREILKLVKAHPEINRTDNCSILQIDALCAIGELQIRQEHKEKALTTFKEVQKILTDKDTKLPEWYIATTWINIANSYYDLDKDTDAEKFYLKAVAMLVSHPEKYQKLLGFLYYRIGNIAFCRKQWQNAKLNFEKSWDNASQAELDTDSLIVLSSKLSICCRKDKQFAKGLKFALTAYKEQKNKYGDNLQTGVYAAGVGSLYNCLNQDKDALKYLEEARQIFKKYGADNPSLELKVSQYIKELQAKNKHSSPGTPQN